jgi:hypothetical protein
VGVGSGSGVLMLLNVIVTGADVADA